MDAHDRLRQRDNADLAEEFASCRRTLLALGDENRQHLILEMMQMKDCRGVRVGKITQKNPSFPPGGIPSSAHLERCRHNPCAPGGNQKLLFLSPDCEEIDNLLCMLQHAKQMMRQLPSQEVAE